MIQRLVDLGGLPLPEGGAISQDESDGVFTPGEWMAVLGRGLDAGGASQVTIDGAPVEIKAHVQGGSLLVQVPRHLAPRQPHQLAVTTPAGSATSSFAVRSYVIVGETHGRTVYFLPLEPNSKTVLPKPVADLDVNGATLHTLSPSGAWLYIVEDVAGQGPQNTVVSQIAIVHMGARKQPTLVGSFAVPSATSPRSVAMLDENTLLVLSERDLVVCEVRGSRGSVVGRTDLPRGPGSSAYVDVEALAGRSAVALEAYGNTVALIDLADPRQPRVKASLEVAKTKGVPWSIDLVPDPDDHSAVWLLQGPNLRISGEKLNRYADGLAGQTKAALGLKKATTAASTTEEKPAQESYARLLRLRAQDGALQIAGERALPSDLFPFHLLAQPKGDCVVSGVTSDVFRFAGLPRTLDGLKSAVDVVTGSLQFGRIVRLRADGSTEQLVKGAALYFTVDALSDGMLVYSVVRPGFRIPFSIQVEWGVESAGKSDADQDYRALVDLEWTSILPPYALGMLSVQ